MTSRRGAGLWHREQLFGRPCSGLSSGRVPTRSHLPGAGGRGGRRRQHEAYISRCSSSSVAKASASCVRASAAGVLPNGGAGVGASGMVGISCSRLQQTSPARVSTECLELKIEIELNKIAVSRIITFIWACSIFALAATAL